MDNVILELRDSCDYFASPLLMKKQTNKQTNKQLNVIIWWPLRKKAVINIVIIASFHLLQFVCCLSTKTPNHYWNNSFLNKQDLAIPDLTSWPIQKPRLFSCTDSRSTSLGVAEAGTLKPDFGALKCRNRVFVFLEYLFAHYRDTKNQKPCWPYRHFNFPSRETKISDYKSRYTRAMQIM